MIEAFPLSWPAGYKRTQRRYDSRFKTTIAQARDFVKNEVRRLNGYNLIISTNIPVRQDGELRSDWTRFKMDDPGVSIYFKYNGNDTSLCCDTYSKVYDNLYAIGKAIEALRMIDRYGVSDFLNRAFTGFAALPQAASASSWAQILGVHHDATLDQIKTAYRNLAKQLHPDTGAQPNTLEFTRVTDAYNQALKIKHT